MSAAAATPAAAAASTDITMDAQNDPYTIREGQAVIKRPPKEDAADGSSGSTDSPSTGEVDEEGQLVFYNPVQVFNRDLSILMIQTFVQEKKAEFESKLAKRKARMLAHEAAVAEALALGKPTPPSNFDPNYQMPDTFPGITILEALSATGLRSVRYFKEIGDVESIIVNDMDAEAVKSIEYNIALNGLTTKQLIPSHSDAITLMQKYRPPVVGPIVMQRPDVIDLDPYGTAAPFLDSAVQAIDEGGLLCITCTDKSILCGNYSETCWAKYGSMPLKGSFCHETAVRLVLNCIATACARYGRHIVPLASMSIDFYVRVFVRVYTSALVVKKQAANMGLVLACSGCESFWPHAMGRIKTEGQSVKHTPSSLETPLGPGSKCPECDSTIKVGGPFWLGPLHNKNFTKSALKRVKADTSKFATSTRIIGMLTVCSEEVQEGEERMMVDRATLNAARLEALKQKELENATATSAGSENAQAAATNNATDSSDSLKKKKDDNLTSILYYSMPHLFQIVNSSCPKICIIRSALIHAGYTVSQTHCAHNAIKTNAPNSVMWDIIRCWVLENPPKNPPKAGSIGARIMAREPRLKANWKILPGTDLSSTATGIAKFLPNPEENWGPKAKAGVKRKGNQLDEQTKKQKLNQNKRTRTRQCKLFAETGTCKFDVSCKYAHIPGTADAPRPKGGEEVSARMSESLSGPEAAAAAKANQNDDAEPVNMQE